jgi:hypothetical protein
LRNRYGREVLEKDLGGVREGKKIEKPIKFKTNPSSQSIDKRKYFIIDV